MRKAKKPDNQAWLAWLSDEQPGHASRQGRWQPSEKVHTRQPQLDDSDDVSHKLSSASTIRLRSQTSAHHMPTAYVAPVPSTRPTQTARPEYSHSDNHAIDINISIPKIRLPKLPHFNIPWRHLLWWGSGVCFIATVVVLTPHILQRNAKQAEKKAAASSSSKPAYAPLKPNTGAVSGAQYDSKRQLYKYNDTYMGSNLTISQQPLPDTLRTGKTKLADVAKASINATDKIETVTGDAYISTDETTGIQRMVIAHRQLLIFIQSTKTLSNVDWVKYIQTLE